MRIFKRSKPKPSGQGSRATYEEQVANTARVWMMTPKRGEREFTVNFSVDDIEDLLRAEDARRKAPK